MHRASIALLAASILTVIDGALKYIVLKQPFGISEGCFDSIFCFALHQNYGIAFSLPIPMWLTLIISAAIIAALIKVGFHFWKQKSEYLIPIVLIFFGAIGNFIDRLINGFTTDYLIFLQLSAINIADILIIAGVILTLWYSFSTDMKKR